MDLRKLFTFRKKHKALLTFFLLVAVVTTVSLIGRQQLLRSRANLVCASSERRDPVDSYCFEGKVMKVFEYPEDGVCRLFYELVEEPCSSEAPLQRSLTIVPSPTTSVQQSPRSGELINTPKFTADVNGDGIVNEFDYSLVIKFLGRGSAIYPSADINRDKIIDQKDLDIIRQNFGKNN